LNSEKKISNAIELLPALSDTIQLPLKISKGNSIPSDFFRNNWIVTQLSHLLRQSSVVLKKKKKRRTYA
jgi:hypothetical protein